MNTETFEGLARSFSLNIIPTIIRKEALEKIQELKKCGDDIKIVTASAIDWVQPWAEAHGIQVIGTELETKDGKITGKISGKNCYGQEKVDKINKCLTLDRYEEILAYGDSRGDRELLDMAQRKFYRCFK